MPAIERRAPRAVTRRDHDPLAGQTAVDLEEPTAAPAGHGWERLGDKGDRPHLSGPAPSAPPPTRFAGGPCGVRNRDPASPGRIAPRRTFGPGPGPARSSPGA